MMAEWQGGQAIIVEVETGCVEPGCWVDYWFIAADGSGDYYYETMIDVMGSDCGDYCGWHKETYGPWQLVHQDGSLHLIGRGREVSLARIEENCQQP